MPVPSRTRLRPVDTIDLQLAANGSHSNVLLVGPEAATLEALNTLQGSLRGPAFSWPQDGAPWALADTPATLIVDDLARLSPDDQARLLRWIQQVGRRPQIVSRSVEPIYPRVADGRFLGDLYYRLNVVYVECG